jgi:hypothetical protein
MTDFESKYKNHPDHWDILRDLIGVITDHALASFSNSIDMADYRKVNKRFPLEEMFGKPYGISARAASRLAFHWQNSTLHAGPMLVFVEKGTLHEGDMVECFRRDGLDDPIPVPKHLPSVQAADLYAWERAYYKRTSIRRPSLDFLKSRMPDRLRAIDGKWEMKSLIRSLELNKVPIRSAIPAETKIVFRVHRRSTERELSNEQR